MIEDLRFVERDGKKILQKLVLVSAEVKENWGIVYKRKLEWVDVPLVVAEDNECENELDILTGAI